MCVGYLRRCLLRKESRRKLEQRGGTGENLRESGVAPSSAFRGYAPRFITGQAVSGRQAMCVPVHVCLGFT